MAERLIDRVKARRDSEGGFTLIELLVVIIILGILAAVVVFSVSGLNSNGQDAACEIDRRTLLTAAEAHYADEGEYPLPAPANWNGTTPATATDAANLSADIQAALISGGFLSDTSEYHTLHIYDNNPGTGVDDITERVHAVEIGACV